MKYQNLKTIFTTILLSAVPFVAFSQEAEKVAADAAASTGKAAGFVMDTNTALAIVALMLLVPIYFAASMLMKAAEFGYFPSDKKSSSSTKKIGIILLLMMSSNVLLAQTKEPISYISGSTFTYVMLFLIALEVAVIAALALLANKFLSKEIVSAGKVIAKESTVFSGLSNYWKKVNNFVPIEKEGDLDTGHSYDGIRELDNVTPPWFTAAFIGSIIFAIVYLYQHHVSHSAPLQIEEFNQSMAIAEEEKNAFLAKQGNNIDENTVTLLQGADIDAGKAIFVQKCAACHSDNAASKPGGVGPNLTDDYWIHGGSINKVFASIKNGWPEKGMISWKDQLIPRQMAQVASYIKSVKGSVPTGGKEPQGELETDAPAAAAATDSTKASASAGVSIDSTKAK
jgi:cytochrome c oxidase cbb3-type subunit III